MKKLNKMCPVCYLKKTLMPKNKVSVIGDESYDNSIKLPPMGWSSWNCFRNRINQKQILEIGDCIAESGLLEAGYKYLNLDDCWQSSSRDKNGNLIGDLSNFPDGIESLIKKLNNKGLKVGLYSSNGTLTCEDLPASLGKEKADALTIAKWGAEYFKYDYCHNIKIPCYAPLVASCGLAKKGEEESIVLYAEDAILTGAARLFKNKKMPGGFYVSGLDRDMGTMVFNNIEIDSGGEYVLTLTVKKYGGYDKFALVQINGEEPIWLNIPGCKIFNHTARAQIVVSLKKGLNQIKIYNPIKNKADSATMQYALMGKMLLNASQEVALQNNTEIKPIVYSICEWGKNKPWRWGRYAGNMWRTTLDIRPWWFWMMHIYRKTVKLYNYSGVGHFNDPDMLEVGNGKLTDAQNRTHFSLWCLMNAPLILGNDLRLLKDGNGKINKEEKILKILTNKKLISINQDPLCKAAKRVEKGRFDVLAKPLYDGVAIGIFNKGGAKNIVFDIRKLIEDSYINLQYRDEYVLEDLWSGDIIRTKGEISVNLEKHEITVFKIGN